MSEHKQELQNEFELERLVLFSDAVFAIAITLLIIEIKFPDVPKGIHGRELLRIFQPTIIQFFTFIVSFLIVGVYWARHLQLCRYLKSYDNKVIVHNLLFLFFIICFPFTASGIGHFTPSFQIPMHLYMVNLFCLTFTYYLLVRNVFIKQPSLSKEGDPVKKKYLLMQSKMLSYMIAVSMALVFTVFFLTDDDQSIYRVGSYQAITFFALIMALRLRKYKPKKAAKTIAG